MTNSSPPADNKKKLHDWCQEARIRWNLWSKRTRGLVILLALLLFWLLVDICLEPVMVVNHNNNSKRQHSRVRSRETSFAVVINTYKRPDMLQDAIVHYADVCGRRNGVSQVFVVWAEVTVEPPSPDSFFQEAAGRIGLKATAAQQQHRSEVTILRVEKDSLNSRFLPIDTLQSQAVFMVDDDVRVDCPSLVRGFDAWKEHPDAMVGYYPRLAAVSASSSGVTKQQHYVYQAWPIVWWRHKMNMVLTKASFFHARYLSLYSDPAQHPVEILEYVDQHMNCEDVAMAMLVANATAASETRVVGSDSNNADLPMIYVEGSVKDKGLFNGISTSKGGAEHMDARSKCLDDLTRVYERHGWSRPLDKAYSLREASWISHTSNWRYRPSNPFEWGALENVFK